jgi:ubiquitin carboxyl-terminal hydrolase 48
MQLMMLWTEWCVKISEKQPGKEWSSPQSSEHLDDVICEHGALQPDINQRRALNGEVRFGYRTEQTIDLPQAVAVLHDYFPDWSPPPEDTQVCEECSKREEVALAEIQLQVDKEMVVKPLYPPLHADKPVQELLAEAFRTLSRSESQYPQSISSTCQRVLVMVPFAFVSEWKQWMRNPQYQERPESLDNSWFLCEHSRLTIDFKNISKFDPEFALIDIAAWNKLCSLSIIIFC